jgi:hypothetical protein
VHAKADVRQTLVLGGQHAVIDALGMRVGF